MQKLLSLRSWPRAIVHIDGDAFFASCEQAMNPVLKGKPVVVGSERGLATAVSYEAKALGIRRGMLGSEIKKLCPECVFAPTRFKLYALYSSRMISIVHRYTPDVEEASIDECYADLTGLRGVLKQSYEDIAFCIKRDLENELGITFSLGLAPTKALAKIASKMNKPSGFMVIRGKEIAQAIKHLPIDAICGVGYQTAAFLRKQGIVTVLDFVFKDKHWIEANMALPYKRLYHELRGTSLVPVRKSKRLQKSISKTGTFYPPTSDIDFLKSHLSKNIEVACAKARRHDLRAKKVSIFIKRQDFIYHKSSITLSRGTSTPEHILRHALKSLQHIYKPDLLYRSTGVRLSDLEFGGSQQDLFEEHIEVESMTTMYGFVDELNKRYGKNTVHLASSNRALNHTRRKKGERSSYVSAHPTGLPHGGLIT